MNLPISGDCFLVSKRIFRHHVRGLTKFHAGSEQLLSMSP